MAVAPQVAPQLAPARPWPAVLAPVALVAGFGGALAGGLVVAAVAAIAGASLTHPPPVVSLISTILQDVAFVASALFFAAQIARPRPAQFGLRSTAVGRAAGALALGYLAFYIFSTAWVKALHITEKEKVVDQLGANNGALALAGVCLLTCVIAPICEEFFFRGFFFTAVRTRCGPWLAATITGIVFGAIHFGSAPPSYLVPLAFFGFVLCIIYWRTASLYPCIALHAVNNSVAVGLTEHWWWWQVAILVAAALTAAALVLAAVARLAPAQ